ncbi:MAG: DUF1489 domain-containing protein [Alphaproteobacteria bacterium]|nr:DUF1489 domain-containing protein [Alphaproteobacteria bacterium]
MTPTRPNHSPLNSGPHPDASPSIGPGCLHLVKMAVGVADIEHLRQLRAARLAERGASWVYTRNHPRRAEAVLAGGSIYWVIRGHIRVRQRVLGFRSERDEAGRGYCLIAVDEDLVPTLTRSCRPFQGWRYLPAGDAPPDVPDPDTRAYGTEMPEAMIAELRSLGLL